MRHGRCRAAAAFGDLPVAIESALDTADMETMRFWLRQALTIASLAEVGIPSSPAG
jgi:hypothetical protein